MQAARFAHRLHGRAAVAKDFAGGINDSGMRFTVEETAVFTTQQLCFVGFALEGVGN